VAFDFAALNAVRHHRNRQDVHQGPASTPAAGSKAASSAIVHRVIHKGAGMVVAAVAGAVDAGGFWAGGMPEIGSAGSGVGLDILGGLLGSGAELFLLWRGTQLGYGAPVLSGAADALLFYYAGKQGQLWGATKRKGASAAGTAGTGTGFDYALPEGRRTPPAPTQQAQTFAYDPLSGFAAQ